MHPLLDLSTLSDEEITTRIGRAYQYLQHQTGLGHLPTIESIRTVIQSLEEERAKRMTRIHDEEYKKKYPKDLEPIELGKLEE